ncbi:MAG: response regulator [Pseudomonadota bacterium]
MISLLRLRSVRHKLLLMVLVANFFTLVTAGGALLYHDLMEHRNKAAAELSTLGGILGQGSVAALEFDDAKVANENLAQLRANPNIVAAAIYTSKGELFARYVHDDHRTKALPAAPQADSVIFDGGELAVFRHIAGRGDSVGTIYLKERYEISAWLLNYLAILGIVLLASLALGVLISSLLQRWISVPIQAVSSVAQRVVEQRNYRLRATKSTEDEIGHLADAFNGMLETLEHEIGERTAAEQSVRTLNAQLEQRVSERTAELQVANRTLEIRTEEAETANRAKADFLANMSHEIRTPMNAILGLAYLLQQSPLSADALDLVSKIRNAGRSLHSIINDILDISKIEAGRLEIEHAQFRLGDVLENLASIMAANAGDKDLELTISPPPAIGGQLIGDALRLEQVLINLTGNAIKFTEHGSINVSIGLLSQDEKIAKLRFAVRDSGIGIPQDKQGQIFAPFSQADVSTTRRFGGTGLGLTICRHLVGNMGGEIGVISAPGRGSEFWFTIPFEWCSATEYASPEMIALEVLIADDSEIARENLSLTARSIGWTAIKADSGEDAIQKLQVRQEAKGSFDVLLVDWKMPGMDGLQAAAAIRQSFGGGACPIVLMVTAFARDELLRQPNIDLVDGILSKPVTSSTLYNSVAEILRRRGLGNVSVPAPIQGPRGKRLPDVRVLVVDDSDINREVAQRILAADGAIVHLANDGLAAVDWLREHPYAVDIVLMDVQMPVMDGYEATRQLRKLPHTADLPVVALTAGAFKAQQEVALQAGMNAFVAKPFNVEELMATVQQLTRPKVPVVPDEVVHARSPSPVLSPVSTGSVLPGIDVTKGLSIWLDPKDYCEYLGKFAATYADCSSLLRASYAENEVAAARALLHKLRGAAGTMALFDVARCAAELETLEASHDPGAGLQQLESALETAFASIAAFSAPSATTSSASPDN